MKEIDENQLRGWQLRRPSLRLKRKIFNAWEISLPAWNFYRLAPALACLLLAVMTFHFNGINVVQERRPTLYADFSSGSNQVAFSDHAQEAQNHLENVTFDWTNHGDFKSSIRSLIGLMPSTNLSN